MPGDRPIVGLVIVSHSAKIAEGIVELAAQMAPGVAIVAAGGTDDGIGTSFERVSDAIGVAGESGTGVVVLCDLGSAILTTETALDFLDEEVTARVRIADAPIVEGAVAAAVAAQIGGDLDAVVLAAESASGSTAETPSPDIRPTEPVVEVRRGSATLINPSGLHARPAAEFVRLAGTFDARISVNGIDAKSLLRIMGLGLARGTAVQIEATGPQAAEAVDALTTLIGSGFGE